MASRVREIHDALVSKKTSAREVLDGHLSIIKKRDLETHAFLDVHEERAYREAARVDEKIARGEKIDILAGIPVALKDNICVKGTRATAASKILEDYTAAYDAHVVEKLRLASAVIVGKTNLDEFAMGGSTENSAFGPTKNPHDSSRVAGGSSGGSAAAVAFGMAPVALGSDTGGSIRQPASFCGVVGFKPSYGRVSRSGLIAMASSLDQIGTFASSVEDAEILFRAIEGKDPMDMTSVETHESVSDKKEYVIGVPEAFLASGPDARVLDLMQKSFKKAESQSASWRIKFEKIDLPSAPYALACYYIIMPAEVSSNLARFDGMRYAHRAKADTLFGAYERTREEGFGSEVKRRIAIGTYVLSHGYYDAYYLQAQRVRTLIVSDFTRAFEKVDAVVFPTTPSHAFKIGEKSSDPLAMYLEDIYTIQANLAGLPAISIPLGKVENLPVGIQFIGKRFGDYALLNFAKRFEAALA
ncbi:MAG: Glutamyl-tRNA(Gln) amidotransferase subunit A [Parcubacteria group bacterium GW2011_GWA2_47_10b]|nr:MAG: Glutamyl-tRNA(Gln) amidotransferase subunit A [Parcubacteria group bacterium GW2011_GWA2_47_10b]